MKKKKALNYIKKKSGFVPYKQIFDIYSDKVDIPDQLINISVKPMYSGADFLICNDTFYQTLTSLIDVQNKNNF